MRKTFLLLLMLSVMLFGCENLSENETTDEVNALNVLISDTLKMKIANQLGIQKTELENHHYKNIKEFTVESDDESLSTAFLAMPNIDTLWVKAPLTQLSSIESLNRLTYLDIQKNKGISETIDFSTFPQLQWLYLNNNELQKVDALTFPFNLDTLHLMENDIQDLTNMPLPASLRVLSISDNKITSLTPIAGLPRLTVLHASNNQITDAETLKHNTELKTLILSGNPIQTIKFVNEMPNLNTLQIANTNVTDISPLSELKHLQTLDISGSNITSVEPLLALENLSYLVLNKEVVKDWSLLEGKNGLIIAEHLIAE